MPLENLLMNLAVNARDAMPRGGRLRIATALAEAPRAGALPPRERGSVPWVELRVEDDGAGMDAATRERAFEPFFTTKGPDKGTGLGLATVFGVIAQHGGAVAIDSAPGHGTTVTAWLPADAGAAVGGEAAVPRPAAVGQPSGSVLVVEDDATIRAIAAEVLTAHGYRVLAARDAAEALAQVDATREPVDVLITDVVMPGMSGIGLARSLTARWPALRVIFASGWTPEEIASHGDAAGGTRIDKPYSPDELVAHVRLALAR